MQLFHSNDRKNKVRVMSEKQAEFKKSSESLQC